MKPGSSSVLAAQGDIARGRRARGTPPSSLEQYAASRNYSSVTDLVSPVWCEYAFQYKLLGQGHLPVSERPEQITTPQGNVVQVNIEIAQQRDKILVAGRQVHKRLEKEIHPVRVRVETTTREDAWGLRLLQLITGLKILMESGCCVSSLGSGENRRKLIGSSSTT
jgi:exonuclease V